MSRAKIHTAFIYFRSFYSFCLLCSFESFSRSFSECAIPLPPTQEILFTSANLCENEWVSSELVIIGRTSARTHVGNEIDSTKYTSESHRICFITHLQVKMSREKEKKNYFLCWLAVTNHVHVWTCARSDKFHVIVVRWTFHLIVFYWQCVYIWHKQTNLKRKKSLWNFVSDKWVQGLIWPVHWLIIEFSLHTYYLYIPNHRWPMFWPQDK